MKQLIGMLLILFLSSTMQASADSPQEQLNQMVEQLQKSPNDNALREQIINLAKTLNPLPALPEEVVRRIARGIVAFKEAKSVSDYKDAVVEFEKATLAAPWYADAYYNLAQARAKAEDYAGTSACLKLYLLAAPGAKDVTEAKALMYEMEYKQEKADKERSATQAKAQQQAQAQRLLESFRGTWYGRKCHRGESVESMNRGCNENEANGSNWHVFYMDGAPIPLSFEFPSDGTVKLNSYSAWAGCGDVFGIPQGPSFTDIRWEERPKDSQPRQVYVDIANDGSWLKVSCVRPLSGASPSSAFRYVIWSRTSN